MSEIEGRLFDGRTSGFKYARLRLLNKGGAVELLTQGEDQGRTFNRAQFHIRERLGDSPRVFEFPEFMRFETPANDVVDTLFSGRSALVHKIENNWPMILFSLVLLMVLAGVGYRYGLPRLARYVAMELPQSALERVGRFGEEAFELKDSPSDLEAEDDLRLHHAIKRVEERFKGRVHVVPIEGGADFKANAFALPNGTIVITDELVELMDSEDQIVGILLHECGHVVQRHTMQLLVQALAVSGFLMLVAGHADWSSLAGGLLTLNYSRAHETEADLFAAQEMRAMGLSPMVLGEALKRLQKHYKDMPEIGFLSSHPVTAERIQTLRDFAK